MESKFTILADAKKEYSHQLASTLKTPIYNGIKSLYMEAKKITDEEDRPDEVLSEFQDFLSKMRMWSQDMIEKEYRRIEIESNCDFIQELITAVFMSHTKILKSIQSSSSEKKQIKLDVPKPEHFIHRCYINAGREFYKNPIFFYDGPKINEIEKQKNIPQSEAIIYNSINETIRQLLPVRNILKTYLQDAYDPDKDEEAEKKEPMGLGFSQTYQNNLREIIKKEIESQSQPSTPVNTNDEDKTNENIKVAESSPKTLTDKINQELKEAKEENNKENKEEDDKESDVEDVDLESLKLDQLKSDSKEDDEENFEDLPNISLNDITSVEEDDDNLEFEKDLKDNINLDDLMEAPTPAPDHLKNLTEDLKPVEEYDEIPKTPVEFKPMITTTEPLPKPKDKNQVEESGSKTPVNTPTPVEESSNKKENKPTTPTTPTLTENQTKTVDMEQTNSKKEVKGDELVVSKESSNTFTPPEKKEETPKQELKEESNTPTPLEKKEETPEQELKEESNTLTPPEKKEETPKQELKEESNTPTPPEKKEETNARLFFDPEFDIGPEIDLANDVDFRIPTPQLQPLPEKKATSVPIEPKKFKFFSKS